MSAPSAAHVAADLAVLIGYVGVLACVRPTLLPGLGSRRDLNIVAALLAGPMVLVVLTDAVLARQAGAANLIQALTGSGSLVVGNALIALAVIAPTFTTIYSGWRWRWRALTGG